MLWPQQESIRALIADVVGSLQSQAANKQIQIDQDIAEEVPPFLSVDGVRFKQILGNLLSNAIKFTSRGTVRITAAEVPGRENQNTETFWLQVCVEDEGIGIKADDEPALFQPFSQADSRVARRHEGTGLGLAICRRLCELMGGRIFFRRRTLKGSIFCFELPLSRPATPPPSPAVPNLVEHHFDRNLSILIVDDSAVNARLLEAILKRSGLSARIVLSGQEALRLFQEETFDVIFMDIQMPGMDGLETTAQIREEERRRGLKPCLIVAVTADILMCDASTSLAAGMDGFLSKPISHRKIEEMLARLLDKKTPHQ